MNIKRNSKGQFDIGNNSGVRFTREGSLGNKHAKGNPPNKTTFKPGDNAMEKHPFWKGGIQKHKEGYFIQLATNKRQKLARYVYEQIYGELPKGHVIYHIDGDRYNDDPSNLVAITRVELIKLNRNSII